MRKTLIALLFLLAAPLVQAQESAEDTWEEPGVAVKCKGQVPAISDFITAILSQEAIGEALGEMQGYWKKYLRHKRLPKDHSFTVDTEGGHMHYNADFLEDDGTRYTHCFDFCCWDCDDGNMLVAETKVFLRDGVPFDGQYSGITFYLYDHTTRLLNFAYAYALGIDEEQFYPEDTRMIVHRLLPASRTVEYQFQTSADPVTRTLVWTGSRFELQDADTHPEK